MAKTSIVSYIKSIEGVKQKRMPSKVEPMKATLVDEPFSRSGWIFENKWDGVRSVCFLKNGNVKLISRNQKDMSLRYPELSDIGNAINAKEAVLDGEIVVVDASGRVDFQLLQSRFSLTNSAEIDRLRRSQKILYYIFDVIHVDGFDLHEVALVKRKAILRKLIGRSAKLKYSAHIIEKGTEFFRNAEQEKLEGIMAKNGQSFYEERRSNEWLKIKTEQRQEVIIVGFTEPKGSRKYFGALHVAAYSGKKLVSLGHVGSGFDHARLKEIYDLMKPLQTKEHPFEQEPDKPSRRSRSEITYWLKPKLVGEVSFTEFTGEGRLRHPVFQGLRDDKKPAQCKIEIEHDASKEVALAETKTKGILRSKAKQGGSLSTLATRSKAKKG